MPIKNIIIYAVIFPIAIVITVFLATVAFNLANDPGAFFSRWANTSSRYAAVADSTKLEAWEAGQKWQAIVDRREAELQKKRMEEAELRKKARERAIREGERLTQANPD